MSNEIKSEEKAVELFESTPWEHTWSSKQDSFEAFTLAVRNDLKADLSTLMPDIGQRTFTEVNTIQLVIGFGALREGARAYASLVRQPSTSSRQIAFERLWAAVAATNDPKNEIHLELRHTLEKLPHMDGVLSFAGNSLLANLVRKIPFLAPHEERIRQMIFVNLLYGVKMEYLFPMLLGQTDDETALMRRMVLAVEPRAAADTAAMSRLKKLFAISDDTLPWPSDHRCVCGQDLALPYACCASGEPIDVSAVLGEIGPDFLLKTDCCGAALTGIRCGACARFYSWAQGVVDSVR